VAWLSWRFLTVLRAWFAHGFLQCFGVVAALAEHAMSAARCHQKRGRATGRKPPLEPWSDFSH